MFLAGTIIFALIFFLGVLQLSPTGLFSANSATEEVIKIGFIGPIGSIATDTGVPAMNGLILANKQFPYANGKRIELIFEDDTYNPAVALSAAKKLVEVDNVQIIVSVGSASTLALLPYSNEKGFLLTTSIAASPKITGAGKYFFRLSSSSKVMASKAAKVAYEKGYRKVAFLYEAGDYSTGWKDSFKNELEALGGSVAIEEQLSGNAQDYKTNIEKIRNADFDLLVVNVITSQTSVNVLKELHELGINKQILGNETFSYSNIVKANSTISEGVLVSTYDYDLTKPETQEFSINYYKEFDYSEGAEVYAALGYDLYNALREGLIACGENPSCLKNFALTRGKTRGIAGEYTIDSNGNAEREVSLNIIQNETLLPQ